jgi:drug/metabolite transporter (DMT)-like permease
MVARARAGSAEFGRIEPDQSGSDIVTSPLPAVSSRSTGWALVGLLAVAAAWGSSFPLTKALLERMTALNFLAVRFSLAALLMVIIFFPALRRLSRRSVSRGLWLGLAYGVAQIMQTIGLQYTPASISGFITGMYVVLTPLCAAVILRSTLGPRVWLGAGIATVGLAILGLNGLSIGFGEAITLASALIYAVHIVGLSAWSDAREALGLATVQLGVTALVSVAAALGFEGGVTLPTTGFDWLAIVYMAVVSGAVAMIVQSWAQAHLAPSRAAITMATEPAWAALFSILFLGEALTWRMAVGGGLMLAAMIIVESGPNPTTDADLPDRAPTPGAG